MPVLYPTEQNNITEDIIISADDNLVFQNEISIQFDEIDELDRVTHA